MVAIKDFGMPSCCENCNISEFDYLSSQGTAHWCCAITENECEDYGNKRNSDCPLIEIEPLTDSEKRIFSAAIMKEHDICAKLDNDKVDDGTVKKLEPIVDNIERKVKKALWK